MAKKQAHSDHGPTGKAVGHVNGNEPAATDASHSRVAELSNLLDQAQTQLHATLEAKEMADRDRAMLAHELRTPLTAIMGFADVMRTELLGPLGHEKYRGYVKDIHCSAQHVLQLCDAVLDLARAQSEEIPIEPVDIRIADSVDKALSMLGGMAVEYGIKLETEIAPDFPILHTDRHMLERALINLVSNAIKFTPRGGRVTVVAKVDPADGAVILVISDTGIGIAREDLARVMRPFVQIKAAQNGKRPGSGLGLPITEALVRRLGGEFELRSKPGVGTAATIRFPRAIQRAA